MTGHAEARIPEKDPLARGLRSPWPPFGASEWPSETWSPSSPGRGGLDRDRWRVVTTAGLRENERWWPERSPTPLSDRQLAGVLEELRVAPGLPWGPKGWPGAQAWASAALAQELPAQPRRERMPQAVPLLAHDWRFGIEGLWPQVLGSLRRGEPLAVQVDGAMPELFADLWEALERVGADLSGVCAWLRGREEVLSEWLAAGRIQRVVAMGSIHRRDRWVERLRAAAPPRENVQVGTLPFGFGLATQGETVPLQYRAFAKPMLVMPADATQREKDCAEISKAAARATPMGASSVARWVRAALQATFWEAPAWAGWAAGAAGLWQIPAQHFSEATEALLEGLEGRNPAAPGPAPEGTEELGGPTPFPMLGAGLQTDVEAVQRLALGKGATLLHTGYGSKRWGQNAMIVRQVFTNVKPRTAQALAAWGTPSLALCRALRA